MNKKLLFLFVVVAFVIVSCGKEELAPTPTSPLPTITPLVDVPAVISDSTTIQWVQGEEENGLYLDSGDDHDTEVVSVGSPPVEARRLGNCQILPSSDGNEVPDCSMQFRIDDSLIFEGSPTTKVRIEVEYFDQGTDSFFIAYDALDGEPYGDILKANKVYFYKADTGVFKTTVFVLEDAFFGNRLYGGDFRIDGEDDGADIILSVKVTLLEEETETADIEEITETADLIFYNGVVLTMETNQPRAQAIAIRDDHILAVGNNESISSYAGPDTQLIDLEGHTLLPGLADGHSHIFWVPPNMTLDEVQDLVLSYGYTSVTEMTSDSGHLERLLQAEADDHMRVRVNVFVTYNNTFPSEDRSDWLVAFWFPGNDPILDSDRMVRVPGVKFFSDEARCPALRYPWPENYFPPQYFQANCDSIYGDSYWPDLDVLNQAVADAQATGYSAAIHAFGDRAIENALDAIAYALDGESNLIYRHQVQHSSYLDDDLVQRYVDMDMLTSVRGYFNTCEQNDYHTHATVNRYALPGLGVHAYLETDAGWKGDPTLEYIPATINPIIHLWGLVTHKQMRQDGTICLPEPWFAEKVITVEQALRMMTYEPIFAVRQEDVLGSLASGKFADMIIISENPLTVDPDDLKDLEVWMTMVGGITEYCKPGYNALCP